ncbi:metallophosphoesterase [Streptomyces sp. NPDC018584]|uniref:metallophosphoesterase n=1 Tax=unclassified Streptomyces TaxID=2593676 RepID=UPI003789FB8F
MAVLGVLVGLAVLAAFAALHWYAWRRLVRDTTAGPGRARRAGTVVFVAGPLLMFAALVAGRAGAPFPLQRILAWPGYLWLALSLYLLLALLVGELVRPLLGRWIGRTRSGRETGHSVEGDLVERASVEAAPAAPAATVTPTPTPAPSRRLFVSRVVGGAVAAAAAGTVGYGTYGVLSGPKVKRVTVPLAKLPRGAHGFRIAVVSDVHLGPILGRGFTQRVVDTVNATQPDLIAVVGDLVDGSVEDLGPAAAPLAGLRSRHGAYFVTGNHEYFSGAEQWVDHVRELGLHPLRNARTELPGFDLAGVDDVAGEDEGEGPDFARALGDRDRSRASVLLAHQPVVIHDAVKHGVDLQLSGHTHGGQLWPGNLVADLANPTLAGLERYGDTQLYVSRGAGAWGPPVRVGAPSDITVVELASRDA